MRCRNKALLSVASALLLAACIPGIAAASGTGVYIDGLSTGLGAAFGAVHVRTGAEFPLFDRWSWALEAELYFSLPADTVFDQADLVALARFRPWPSAGFYLGAGPGLAWFDSRASGSAGGASAYDHAGIKGFLIAETGWTIRFGSFPLYFEPFLRAFGSAGWESTTGSALPASSGPSSAWPFSWGMDTGLQAGWRF
jgi:hypothetical protein